MLISQSFDSVSKQEKDNPYYLIIMLIIFVIIFYFTVLLPQQKKVKEYKKLIRSVSKGDEILTKGGIIGRVKKISDTDYITISVNNDNEILIKRSFIVAILPRGTINSI
ncbi:preprotein translocase subunit YajC [Candidatus Riesia sp. GBBU]|nr:preprotein translocase subunit YajC [Candidatus Riesia sp. GBBU]